MIVNSEKFQSAIVKRNMTKKRYRLLIDREIVNFDKNIKLFGITRSSTLSQGVTYILFCWEKLLRDRKVTQLKSYEVWICVI